MRKSLIPFLVVAMLVSVLVSPGQTVKAQGVSLPAEINKSFTPISIAAGGTSVLRVTIFNPNVFALTNTSWTDNLIAVQPGLRIANPVGLTNTCGGVVTAVAGSTTLSLSGGTVPAQIGSTAGSCTVSINVTSLISGSLINTIPVGALSATGGGTNISNTSPASATLNVTGAPTPTVSKSFSPNVIWAGATSRLTVVIRNNLTTTSLTQASITDSLPANVFLADPVSPTLTGCGASASLTAVGGGTSFTLNDGTIAPSSTCSITVSVTSSEQGAYTNTIPAGALETEQDLTNVTPASARLDVQEIGITKGFSPATFVPGQISILTITLQNPTDSAYTDVNVTDNLPAPVIVAGTATTTCGTPPVTTVTTTSNSVTLDGGIIPAGSPTTPGTCQISVPVTVPAGTLSGTFRNSIPEGALTTEQGVGNLRSAQANVTVRGSDILASKSFSPTSITAGGSSRLRIAITAPGDTDLTNFSITDNLPAGITISNSTPATALGCGATPPRVLTADTGATSISLTNGLILAGQQCRIDVYVTGNLAGSYTNTIPVGNITNDQGRLPAGSISSTLNVTSGSTLAIDLVKGFDPLIVTGGASSTMSIELINPGTATLTGIAFTDNMPANMILANPVNFNVGTCGGTLTGTPGDNSFSFSGGSLPPLTSCTLTLRATMTVNGNLTNTIPAGAVTTDQRVTNADPVQASLTNLPGASVSKSFSPNPIPANSFSLLTITIRNTGNIELVDMGMSDSLPSGLVIAGGSAPAPVNQCGGTLTAVSGTQLVELTNANLAGNSSCTMVVAITGNTPGDYQNLIPVGALQADPAVQNNEPATATLTIIAASGGGGGGGGGGGRPTATAGTTIAQSQAFLIPVTGFAPGRVTELDIASHTNYAPTGLTIDIPVLKVNTPIVGVESKNGNWDVSWLQNQAGWLNGTAYPTWKGNSVLTGHVANTDGKPGLFAKLKYLGVGEYIFIYNSGYRYTYKVVSNEYVQPDDANVMKHEEKSYLTLITCDTYDEKMGTYLRRVAVRAMLVDVRLAP
jgi:LPXTG-site transpeptidase (sortase) family protein